MNLVRDRVGSLCSISKQGIAGEPQQGQGYGAQESRLDITAHDGSMGVHAECAAALQRRRLIGMVSREPMEGALHGSCNAKNQYRDPSRRHLD